MACNRIQFSANAPKPDAETMLIKFRQTITTGWYHNHHIVGKRVTALDYYLDYMEADFHNRRFRIKRLGNLYMLKKPDAAAYVLMDCRKLAGGREKIHAITNSGWDVVSPTETARSLSKFMLDHPQVLLDFYANKRKNAYGILITLLMYEDNVYYTVKTVNEDGEIDTLINT